MSTIPRTGQPDDADARKDSERSHTGNTDAHRLQSSDYRKDSSKPGAKKDEQESLIAREERQGIGLEEEEHRREHDVGDDFGMEL